MHIAPRIAVADPDAEFEFEIHFQARAEGRQLFAIDHALAVGAAHRHTAGAHGRGTAVIGHRHIFVVGA
jgi:hypothetical protein